MEIIDESGMMHSIIDKVKPQSRLVHYVHIPLGATPETFKLEDNVVYAISLEDVDEFTMTVLPSESELKAIYKYNFVLNEITEDGYYVFIKEK